MFAPSLCHGDRGGQTLDAVQRKAGGDRVAPQARILPGKEGFGFLGSHGVGCREMGESNG